jgi:membrane protein DedA with SNARE-associated domain
MAVLAEYVGVPFPSFLLLILAGALSYEGHLNPLVVLLLTLVAASLGDTIWFTMGRVRGNIFLEGYCRLSLGSQDCVRRTKEFFQRFPRASLLVGKFMPGVSTFVIPVAGFSGMRYSDFLRFDSLGILLWGSSMLGIGYWSGQSIYTLLGNVRSAKPALLVFLALFLICFYTIKLLRLWRYGRAEIGKV